MTFVMEDLQLTYAQGGWLLSCVFLTMTIFFIPCGLASDRWGRKIFVVFSLLLTTIGSISLIWCSSFLPAMLTRIVIGIGYAMYVGPSVAMLANWFPSRQLGFAVGIWLVGYFLGMGLGELIPPLLKEFGWRNAIWITASPGFIIALLCLIFTKDRPDEVGLPSLDINSQNTPSQNLNEREKLEWSWILKSKDLWICGLWVAGAYAGLSGVAAWLPTFANRVHGLSLELSGLISGLATGGVGIIMAIPGGLISDRIKRRLPLMILTNVILGISMIGIVYCDVGSLWLLIIFALLIGIGVSLGVPAGLAYPAERAGLEVAGSAVNMTEAIGSIGGLVSPWIMGLLFDIYHSWTVSFLVVGLAVIMSGFLCFLAKETHCAYLR